MKGIGDELNQQIDELIIISRYNPFFPIEEEIKKIIKKIPKKTKMNSGNNSLFWSQILPGMGLV